MKLRNHDTVLALKIAAIYCVAYEQIAEKYPDIVHYPRLNDASQDIYEYAVGVGVDIQEMLHARKLAEALELSHGEISKSLARLKAARLVAEGTMIPYLINLRGLEKWCLVSMEHANAPEIVGLSAGMKTGWHNPHIVSEFIPREMSYVWPGTQIQEVEGEALVPLYKGAPQACLKDKKLYTWLSMLDIVRLGKPRELKIISEMIHNEFGEAARAQQFFI